jgi:tetratricopeptide (TPR) repeat protein
MFSDLRIWLKKYQGFLVTLAVIGGFLYAFNLHNPLFWDDVDWIVNNPAVHAFTLSNIRFIFSHDVLAGIGLSSNYYRPVLLLTFIFNYISSGISPLGYHLLSNAIHVVNALLAGILVDRLFRNRRLAFLSALFFLIHPIQTEAVAYISGRGDPLSVMFMLVGFLSFLYFWPRRLWPAYLTAGLAMVLAILSREVATIFPLYLIVILIVAQPQPSLWPRIKKAVWPALSFFGISAAYLVLRATVLNFENTFNFYRQQNLYSEHLTYRVYTFLHALAVYVRLTVLPWHLHMEHTVPISLQFWQGYAWLGTAIIVALMGWLVWTYRRRPQEEFNVLLLGLGLFFINLGPSSGIVPVNAVMYEHWLYFSLLGAGIILAYYGLAGYDQITRKHPGLKSFLIILTVGYSLFLGIQTIQRNLLWGNTESFYLNILKYEPNNVRVLNNLANWYMDEGRSADAQMLYKQAIDSDPGQPAPYYNLGNIARDDGNLDQAESLYKKSIALDSGFHYAYTNLASLYVKENRIQDAIQTLEQLDSFQPSASLKETINALKKYSQATGAPQMP